MQHMFLWQEELNRNVGKIMCVDILSLAAEQRAQDTEDLNGSNVSCSVWAYSEAQNSYIIRCMNLNWGTVMKCMRSLKIKKGFEFNGDVILKSLTRLTNNEMKGRGFPSDWALLYLCSGVHTTMQIILMMLGHMKQHKRKSQHFISGLWFSLKDLRQGSPFLDGSSPMSFLLTYSLTGLQRRFFHNLKAFFAKCLLLSFTMNSSLHTDVYV